jgi:hypothetical protein
VTGYSPADMGASLTAGVAGILPYVAAGVVGGCALLFVFLGIRKGLEFFRELIDHRRGMGWGDDMADQSLELSGSANSRWQDDWFAAFNEGGMSMDDALAFADRGAMDRGEQNDLTDGIAEGFERRLWDGLGI